MSILQNISAVWQKVSLIQKATMIAIVVAAALVTVFVTTVATKADMALLLGDLDYERAGRICDKLDERGIPYQIKSGGKSIFVPADQVNIARLNLATDGVIGSEKKGYSILDNSKIGISPMLQQVNRKRAIEDELAGTIKWIEAVTSARVHLVTPDQTLFTAEKSPAKASVILAVRPGYTISNGNIAAITNLVSGAVEGLEPKNVTITDNQGRLLTSKSDSTVAASASTYLEYKEKVESSLSKKVQDMLELVLGPGKSSVQVSAELDMTSINTQKTEYGQKGVPTKENITTTKSVKNVPVGESKDTLAPSTSENEETTETEMLVDKTIINKLDMPGQITALTVSAVVDLSLPAAVSVDASENPEETENAPQPETAAPTMLMTVEQVEELIRNALGRELLKDKDSLTVVNAPIAASSYLAPILTEEKAVPWDKYFTIIRHSSIGLLGLCALIALKIFASAKNKASADSEANPAAQLEAGTNMLLSQGQTQNEQFYRQYIVQALKDDPQQVKQLFSNWIGDEA